MTPFPRILHKLLNLVFENVYLPGLVKCNPLSDLAAVNGNRWPELLALEKFWALWK